MKYAKIELFYGNESQGGYIDRSGDINLSDLIDGLEVGEDSYHISIVEMTKEELDALPEFDGF
jgi:hypothetical protein